MGPLFGTYPVASAGLVASLQAKASSVRLHRLFVTNTNVAARYCQIFDATGAIPAEGTAPLFSFAIGAGQTPPGFDFGPDGLVLTNGLWIVNSTTPGVKTLAGTDQYFKVLIS